MHRRIKRTGRGEGRQLMTTGTARTALATVLAVLTLVGCTRGVKDTRAYHGTDLELAAATAYFKLSLPACQMNDLRYYAHSGRRHELALHFDADASCISATLAAVQAGTPGRMYGSDTLFATPYFRSTFGWAIPGTEMFLVYRAGPASSDAEYDVMTTSGRSPGSLWLWISEGPTGVQL